MQCLDYQPQVFTQGGGRVWQCCGCDKNYTRYLDVRKMENLKLLVGADLYRRAIVRAINIIQKESGIEYVCAGNVWQSRTPAQSLGLWPRVWDSGLGSWCVAIWGIPEGIPENGRMPDFLSL